jgi:hypothetical protein
VNPQTDLDPIRDAFPLAGAPSPSALGQAREALLNAIAAERPAPAERRRHHRAVSRVRVLAAVAATLAGATTAAAATRLIDLDDLFNSHAAPARMFAANPAAVGPWTTNQHPVIPGTTRLVETVSVPHVGRVQYWTAAAAHDGICLGLRLPDGRWDDLSNSGLGSGPVPGCTWIGRGFFWNESQFSRGFDDGRLLYGIVRARGRPVQVRDTVSGATGRVVDGRYFMLLIPAQRHGLVVGGSPGAPIRRVTYDVEVRSATGRVIERAAEDIEP